MYSHLQESSFPTYYRQEEMQTLRQVIERRRSLLIAGPSGMGKSNLVRFFASHPPRDSHVVTLYVDCNYLKSGSENELYTAIIDEFALTMGTTSPEIATDSAWKLRQTLQNQVRQIASSGSHLVLVLDRFEQFLPQKDDLYNFLRSLRDIAGARISYVLAARSFPPRNSLGELGELFEPEPLWVGPLNRRDAFDSVERDGKRLGHSFKTEQRQRLYDLTGGHPGLLKNACEIVATANLDLTASPKQIVKQLLESTAIQDECDELWASMDDAEKAELVQCLDTLEALSAEIKQSLCTKSVLTQDKTSGWRLFSSLLEHTIRNSQGVHLASLETEVQIEMRGNKVFVDNCECLLARKEFLLFRLLFERRGEVVERDEIASQVWPEHEGDVSAEMIDTLKSCLSRKLKAVREAEYIQTHRGRGYELLKRVAKPGG
jgi:hypothetical protein